VDERAAEEMFRHKVLGLLRRRGLVSQERIELLLSWRHSGFSVHNRFMGLSFSVLTPPVPAAGVRG
jgi:hypothetical protein